MGDKVFFMGANETLLSGNKVVPIEEDFQATPLDASDDPTTAIETLVDSQDVTTTGQKYRVHNPSAAAWSSKSGKVTEWSGGAEHAVAYYIRTKRSAAAWS